MRFMRRRSDRPDSNRRRQAAGVEALEGRELLAGGLGFNTNPYQPSNLPLAIPYNLGKELGLPQQTTSSPRQLLALENQGKFVEGQNRQGDTYILVVHGPGAVIVTDATPNDGVLDDDITSIQLTGTDINSTYVTGGVIASNRVQTDGTVLFNKLIAPDGVNSIILHGFTLAETVAPPAGEAPNQNTGIFLYGGVRNLEFHNIDGSFDTATGSVPINIQIGDPTTPGVAAPVIALDEIFNTVITSTSAAVPTGPQTNATVNLTVNGEVKSLRYISSTSSPSVTAGNQYLFPTVGVTGRTAVRATGINRLDVKGSAINTTFSKGQVPFSSGLSGLDHLGKASFGGNADAVGIDVKGRIGGLRFRRGLGNANGTTNSGTTFGTPTNTFGYPAAGLLGGKVTAASIGHVAVGQGNTVLVTSTNPTQLQLYRTGSTNFLNRPGNALTSATIASSGSIGKLKIHGNLQGSTITAGAYDPSRVAGLQPVRAASHIRNVAVTGDLVNSVVTASVRPGANNTFGTKTDVVGKGSISGHFTGTIYSTNAVNADGTKGVGFFARRKTGYLPPPQKPTRVNGVLVRNL